MDGSIVAIWRYPVKSMLGEELASATIGERGLAGDRAYALVDDETGKVVSAKNPRRWGMLFSCRARYLAEPEPSGPPPPAEIRLADGSVVRTDDPEIDALLSGAVGRAVHLATEAPPAPVLEEYWPDVDGVGEAQRDTVSDERIALLSPAGTFFDGAPVHVVTTSTLDSLGQAHPDGAFDPRRFRPNLVVDTNGEGFPENAWVGRHLEVGTTDLHIVLPVPRCVMTTLAQDDLVHDRRILQTVAQKNRLDVPGLGPSSCVGVYGLVVTPGAVGRGESVSISE